MRLRRFEGVASFRIRPPARRFANLCMRVREKPELRNNNAQLSSQNRVWMFFRGGKLETSSVRVLVVEDSEPFRNFTRSVLGKRPELQIVREVTDGLQAIQKAEELKPDLILLDFGLPTLNGIEVAGRLRTLSPESKILFVSQELSASVIQGALAEGAQGYVLKTDARRELLTAVDAVLRGDKFVSSSLCSIIDSVWSFRCTSLRGLSQQLISLAPAKSHEFPVRILVKLSAEAAIPTLPPYRIVLEPKGTRAWNRRTVKSIFANLGIYLVAKSRTLPYESCGAKSASKPPNGTGEYRRLQFRPRCMRS